MADIKTVTINNTVYDIKDQTARDDISDLKSAVGYVTPEMYGALGDGINDDSSYIQDAVDSGKTVYMFNTYKINNTIEISNDNTKIYCDGKIVFDNDITIFDIKSNGNTIRLNDVEGSRSEYNNTTKLWAFNGTLFKLDADNKTIQKNSIRVNVLDKAKTAFDCYANGTFGVMYNDLEFESLFVGDGISFSCGSSGLPWINGNKFSGVNVRGNYGVITKKGTSQTDPFNGNVFSGIGFEGIYCAVKAEFFQYNSFIKCRMSESLNGDYWIDIDSSSYGNIFNTTTILFKDKINDLNSNIEPNVYESPKVTATSGGVQRIFGLGGKVFKNSAGWTAEKAYPSQLLITVAGDGDSHDVPNVGLLNGWMVNVTRENNIAIVNIPNNSGYGYGNGAEIVYFRISAGNYKVYIRYNGINKAILETTDSGYYEFRYIHNYDWKLIKISGL